MNKYYEQFISRLWYMTYSWSTPFCGFNPHDICCQVNIFILSLVIHWLFHWFHNKILRAETVKGLYIPMVMRFQCTHRSQHDTRWNMYADYCIHIMTSSNGNIFHVTSLLCREFTSHRWIPCTMASDVELWCFLWSAPEPTVEQTM